MVFDVVVGFTGALVVVVLLLTGDFTTGLVVVFTGVFTGVFTDALLVDGLSGVASLVVVLLFAVVVDLVDFGGVFVLLLRALEVEEPVTAAAGNTELVAEDTVALATGVASVADIGCMIMELSCNCSGGGLMTAWYSFFGNGAHAARK